VGTVALWYPSPTKGGDLRRREESAYAAGVLHGITRSWHANGEPRSEYRYERGVLAEAAAWSDSGRALASADAREQAARDRATDAAEYASLERLVADNAPQCE
jgi:antitoxin component YwqK of YwqJK toxin-antitoxin module